MSVEQARAIVHAAILGRATVPDYLAARRVLRTVGE
jgi:hypothetical protein